MIQSLARSPYQSNAIDGAVYHYLLIPQSASSSFSFCPLSSSTLDKLDLLNFLIFRDKLWNVILKWNLVDHAGKCHLLKYAVWLWQTICFNISRVKNYSKPWLLMRQLSLYTWFIQVESNITQNSRQMRIQCLKTWRRFWASVIENINYTSWTCQRLLHLQERQTKLKKLFQTNLFKGSHQQR